MGGTEDGPGDAEPNGPSLGKRLFSARIERYSGKLAVGFGPDGTLVVADQHAAVCRWSLPEKRTIQGASGPGFSAPRTDLTYEMGTQLAVSSDSAAVVVARGSRCDLIHFTGSECRTATIPFDRAEFLVPATGTRFATHTKRCLRVRDFADGRVVWEQPCPPGLASSAIDARGTTVAMAGQSGRLSPSDKLVVTSQDDRYPREFTFRNFPAPGTGCNIALSPDGELAVCVSFREILLLRTRTGEAVRRRSLIGWRGGVRPALGPRPQRLICTADGQVLWLRDRRVVNVNWSGQSLRYLTQDGLCDDIALDHENSRLAMVSEAGEVSVFEWRQEDDAADRPRSGGHAFISYVREDSAQVEHLQRALEAAGIPVWRDTSSLWPGEEWEPRIRDAIQRNALVFIACISSHSNGRQRSYMRNELLMAAEEFRLRQPGVPWLIPVRFDDCALPDLDLGAGRTLKSIQQVNLFGPDRERQLGRLIETVRQLLPDR